MTIAPLVGQLLAPVVEALFDHLLVAALSGKVIAVALESFGQIVLGDECVIIVVGVFVFAAITD